jgi:hypothetical protein
MYVYNHIYAYMYIYICIYLIICIYTCIRETALAKVYCVRESVRALARERARPRPRTLSLLVGACGEKLIGELRYAFCFWGSSARVHNDDMCGCGRGRVREEDDYGGKVE